MKLQLTIINLGKKEMELIGAAKDATKLFYLDLCS